MYLKLKYIKMPFDYLPDLSEDSHYRSIFGDAIPDGMSVETFVEKFGYDEDGEPRNYEEMKKAIDEYNARK